MAQNDIVLKVVKTPKSTEGAGTTISQLDKPWDPDSALTQEDVIEIGKINIQDTWLDQIYHIFMIKFELRDAGPTITEMETTIRDITARSLHEYVPFIPENEAREAIMFQEKDEFFHLYFSQALWKKAYMTLAGRNFITTFVFPLQERIRREFGSILKVHHRSILDWDFFFMLCIPFILAFQLVFLCLSTKESGFKIFCFGISVMGASMWWTRTNFPFKDTSSTWRTVPVTTAASLAWNNFWPFATCIIGGSILCSCTIVNEWYDNQSTFNLVWMILSGPLFFTLAATAFVCSIKSFWFSMQRHMLYTCFWLTLCATSCIIFLARMERKPYLGHDYPFAIGQFFILLGFILNLSSFILAKQNFHRPYIYQIHWVGSLLMWFYFLFLPIICFYQERFEILI